jgi:zinc transport system ATP-binding protein
MPHILCDTLSLAYEGKTVVKHLNIQINKGDYLCIVGENGSGKTTLLKAILGLKKPRSGRIVLHGFSRKDMGYMPQQSTLQQDFPATVKEVVRSGLKMPFFSPFYPKAQKEKMKHIVSLLELEDILSKPFGELSGGQAGKVLLARALCAANNVLLLDEPAAGLDPAVTEKMYGWIQDLHKQGFTILMISHDVEKAVEHATHILHLGHTPLFFGTAKDYRDSDAGKRFLKKGVLE